VRGDSVEVRRELVEGLAIMVPLRGVENPWLFRVELIAMPRIWYRLSGDLLLRQRAPERAAQREAD
jgi:hypothetical protein